MRRSFSSMAGALAAAVSALGSIGFTDSPLPARQRRQPAKKRVGRPGTKAFRQYQKRYGR